MPIRRNNNNVIRQVKPNIIRKTNTTIRKTNPVNPTIIKQSNDNNKYSPVNKIWDDETIYIIGGGPSLKNFDWNLLKGKKIIAINRAYEVLPWAEVLYWTDSRFYKWYKSDIDMFGGLKVTCRPFPSMPHSIALLKSGSSNKLDMRESYITHGNNSGYGAINLAVKLGAKKIYLLGYDMDSNPKLTHWHDGYQVNHNHTIYSKMITQFQGLDKELSKLNIEIFNANIKSKLDVFRKCSLEDSIYDRAYNPFRNA